MPRHLLRAVCLVALFAGTLGVATPALAVDTPFSVRYAQTMRGSIDAVGNQLLTCPAAAAGCTDARNRIGTSGTLNNNYDMGYVDVDGDAATINSSTATLSLPAGATVVWAGLYWGADTSQGAGGSAAPNAGARGTVRFKVGSSSYQTVTAAPADVLTSTGRDTRYRAFANVTALLPAAGDATYTIGNVQTGRGDDRFAGWSLVVAYRDSTQAVHRVSVYDGLGTVDATHQFSTIITPFFTPASGTVATKTGLLAFEGDTGIVGETATFNGTALTDAINGPGNLMNSTMAVDGTLVGDKNPDYGNLMGTDIDVWNKTGFLDNHQSSATLAFASNQDLFVPSALWLVSDEGPAANTSGPTVGGQARDGSTLSANAGTWNGTPTITYEYQWQRCDAAGQNCVDIPGETGTTYTLTPDDVGSTVRVLVTAVNGAGSSTPAASLPSGTITMIPPSNVTPPALGGDVRDGQTLTSTLGIWNGTEPLSYGVQWQRCDAFGASCTDIADATGSTYTLTGVDVGLTVRSRVTATNDADSAIAASPATGAVVPDPPANVTVPTTLGTVRDGEVLTADTGSWTGTGPIDFTYVWERCDDGGAGCQPIVGATGDTYMLGTDDLGSTVRVSVTGDNAVGTDIATSPPTITVDGNPPVNVVDPALTGTARDGETLTLDDGDWTGTPSLTPTYQWERCDATGAGCGAIADATGLTYTLQAADVDGTVRAVVTYTNDYGSPSEATAASEIVLAAPPAVTLEPSVGGIAVDGETVSADPGVWAGTAPVTFTYQWLRCELDGSDCVPIDGATGDEHTLTPADADHGIRVEVTATNAADSVTALSPVAAVNALGPQNTTPPTVLGTLVDGETLTVDEGIWSGTTPLDYVYEWLRCDGLDCVVIPGATGAEYTLNADDVGHELRVAVEASNSGGSDQAVSALTGDAVELAPPVSVTPVITGLEEDGATLAVITGGWSGSETITFTYQWQRCDGADCVDIDGATDATYTVGTDDLGSSVRVEVTGTNLAGHDVGTSAPSDEVEAAPPVSTAPPAVSGSLVDGQTLTADPGAFSGTGPLDYGYQWQRCDITHLVCVDIPNATGSTYDLVSADVGGAIVVEVTARNGGGTDSATSPATGEVRALAPANVDPPTISGDPLDGQTLTVDPGTWSGTTPVTFTYQWQQCDENGANCVDIPAATDPTYTLVQVDIDHVLSVVVTASNGGGSAPSGAVQTAPAQAAPPANTLVPTVSGTLEDGETLTAVPGTWSGTPTITYDFQWQRCDAGGTGCVDIDSETGLTYELVPADVGHAIVVEVSASNDGGDDVATSAPSRSVAVDPPASPGTPVAAGTPADGETLTAEPGTWTGTGTIDFTYQWQRCDLAGIVCVDIDGATDDTYTLGTDDIGSTVLVLVTGDNGEQTTIASPAVGPVDAVPPVSTGDPTVLGTVGFGDTLTAGDGTWDGSEPLTFTYQWQTCDATAGGSACTDIPGETGSTHELTPADVGHAIRVEVTATNAAGGDSAFSAPTAAALPAPPVNTSQPPAPTGDVVDGRTLTAAAGTWTGDGTITYEYQWQRCGADGTSCEDIDGETGETYAPTGDDVGQVIVVEVTATNPGGSATETSAPTETIEAAPPLSTSTPSIIGTPADGGTLTVEPGTWTGTGTIDFEYQWQRCDADGANCLDIPGATGDTYTPGSDDIGDKITVVVTAGNDGGEVTETAAVTSVVVASPPNETTPPGIAGGVELGGTLTADPGGFSGTGPFDITYQWQRCDEDGADCVDVPGATAPTYTLGEDDRGHTTVVLVTATNDEGTHTSTSEPSLVLPAPPANIAAPAISGNEEVGETLTADPGSWSGTGPLGYDYQWQRCDFFGDNCVDIPGAAGPTYTLTDEDLGQTIQVVVTASNAAGTVGAVAPTTPAVINPPAPTPSPSPGSSATPEPAVSTPSGPGTPAGLVSSSSAFEPGLPGGEDLGSVPGSLVGDTSCQQLAGNAKYRRVKLKGIGTVRVRAYATGPATRISPIRVTTQISGGKASRVRYKLDGRSLKAKRGRTWKSAITPSKLRKVGIHKLKATVTGRRKRVKPRVVALKLKTVPCRTLFTAQRWRTTAGAGLRLRVDARSAMSRVSFKVPAPLLPRTRRKARTVGFMRVFVAGEAKRRRFSLKLAKKGGSKALLAGAGKPAVRVRKGGLEVSGLPARSAVTELTLYRVKKLDGATKRRVYRLRARVAPAGRTLSVRPRAPR